MSAHTEPGVPGASTSGLAAAPASNHPCSCSPNPPLPSSFAVEPTHTEGTDSASSTTVANKWASLLIPSSATSGSVAVAPSPSMPQSPTFEWARHVQFFALHLKSIPQGYESLVGGKQNSTIDTSRMTLLYFCLSALDVLGAIDSASVERWRTPIEEHSLLLLTRNVPFAPLVVYSVISKGNAPKIIDWIYAQQVHPYTHPDTGVKSYANCGFRGGTSMGVPFNPTRTTGLSPQEFPFDEAHIAMTYTALCSLRILGDDFSRVNKRAVIGALRYLQQDDGSFSSTRQRSESDMRFLYCACSISAMLCDWSGFDIDRSISFIRQSQSYDGGIGLWPGCEGHGGSTYCAVASLRLMNKFSSLPSIPSLLKWTLSNQGSGYRGRPNKDGDSCYSFWLGATLQMVGKEMGQDIGGEWTNKAENRTFNLTCQSKVGGFTKEPGPYHPDLLHSYFGVCGLSLIGFDSQLQKIDCMLGLTLRAAGKENQRMSGDW